MKISQDALLETFREMTLLELSGFVKRFEETFDVKAVAQAPAAIVLDAVQAEPEDEQAEFDVYLDSIGDKKIQVIKEIRPLTGLGLKEAKDLVDASPGRVLMAVSKEVAEKAVARLADAGARASFR